MLSWFVQLLFWLLRAFLSLAVFSLIIVSVFHNPLTFEQKLRDLASSGDFDGIVGHVMLSVAWLWGLVQEHFIFVMITGVAIAFFWRILDIGPRRRSMNRFNRRRMAAPPPRNKR